MEKRLSVLKSEPVIDHFPKDPTTVESYLDGVGLSDQLEGSGTTVKIPSKHSTLSASALASALAYNSDMESYAESDSDSSDR